MKGSLFARVAAMAMAMFSFKGNEIKQSKVFFRKDSVQVKTPNPRRIGVCFHRSFSGKKQRVIKKNRNMNHVSKLTKLKHRKG